MLNRKRNEKVRWPEEKACVRLGECVNPARAIVLGFGVSCVTT